jgi:hypothetical protein
VTFAWTSLVVGVAALVIGLTAPLAPDPARVVWIARFGAMAVWAGGMAIPRYRRAGRGRSALAITGIATGIASIAVMAYAFTAIALAPTDIALPAPANWVSAAGESTRVAPDATDSLGAPGTTAGEPSGHAVVAPEASESTDPLEAERLELGQSLGTATFVLRQTASADGTWPAALAITTDGTTLMSPNGIILAPIPAGAQVLYSTSSDRAEYSLTLIGPSGVTATFVSTTGVIETSVP